MVGTASSKGCTTCRRRKVACDQRRPYCLRCLDRGLPCEGYAKDPVLWRRERARVEQRLPYENGGNITSFPWDTVKTGVLLPRKMPSEAAMLGQIEVKCLESYLPESGSALHEVKTSWMYSIFTLCDLGRTLSSAFAALSLARVGLVHQDQDLISQSRSQYDIALSSLRHVLRTPELAFQDRTLAAMRALSIYEHLSPTFAPVPPGRVHEDGMAQWCLAAGPQSISTGFAVQVFQDVRWSIMGHSIESRKGSVLGNASWKALPWQHFEKDSLQLLFDIGFDLAAMLERTEAEAGLEDSKLEQAFNTELWSGCVAIFGQLEEWHNLHWAKQVLHRDVLEARPEFASFWEATNLIYYWLFKLILDETVLSLSDRQSQFRPLSSTDDSPALEGPTSKSKLSKRRSVLAVKGLSIVEAQQVTATSQKLAADIVLAAPYFLANDTGWLGPQRLFFPLRRAMQHLEKIQSPLFVTARLVFMELIARLRSTCENKA